MVGYKDSKLFFDRHHEFNSIESQGSPPAHAGLQLMIPDDLSGPQGFSLQKMGPTCILVVELTERFLTPSDNAVQDGNLPTFPRS